MKQSKSPEGWRVWISQKVTWMADHTDSFGSVFSSHILSLKTNNDSALIFFNELFPNPLAGTLFSSWSAPHYLKALQKITYHWKAPLSTESQYRNSYGETKLVVMKQVRCSTEKRKCTRAETTEKISHGQERGNILCFIWTNSSDPEQLVRINFEDTLKSEVLGGLHTYRDSVSLEFVCTAK